MWAVSMKCTEMIHLLIEKGADVNMKDKNGNTALSLAKRGGLSNIVQLLEKSLQVRKR